MNEDEWEALQALKVFETVTFPRVQRRLTLRVDSARQAREVIERQGAGASVEVTRQEMRTYIVKFNW